MNPPSDPARVRQVVVKFDGAATTFGDPKAPAPFAVKHGPSSIWNARSPHPLGQETPDSGAFDGWRTD